MGLPSGNMASGSVPVMRVLLMVSQRRSVRRPSDGGSVPPRPCEFVMSSARRWLSCPMLSGSELGCSIPETYRHRSSVSCTTAATAALVSAAACTLSPTMRSGPVVAPSCGERLPKLPSGAHVTIGKLLSRKPDPDSLHGCADSTKLAASVGLYE